MKKLTKIVIAGAVALVIGATSVTAIAASAAGPWNMMAGFDNKPYITSRTVTDDSEEFDALQAQCLDRMKAVLDARVAAGVMSQAQADEILAAMKERQEAYDGTGYGYGMMGGTGYVAGYGFGMMGGQNGYGYGMMGGR